MRFVQSCFQELYSTRHLHVHRTPPLTPPQLSTLLHIVAYYETKHVTLHFDNLIRFLD